MVRIRTVRGRGGKIFRPAPYDLIFAENVKAARVAFGLTQQLVGDPCSLNKRTISRIENYEHGATIQTASAIAEGFGFTLVQMLMPPKEFAKLLPKKAE